MILSIAASLLLATAKNAAGASHPKASTRSGMHHLPPPVNTICPVSGYPVKPGMGVVVTVRGRHYRVCHSTHAEELVAHPDQYLTRDGTPKNEVHGTHPSKTSMPDMPGMKRP